MVIRRRRSRTQPRRARALVATAAVLALAACGEGSTGPATPPALSVAFLDAQGRLNTARSGEARVVTPVVGSLPYASTRGAVALVGAGALRLYHMDDGSVDTLPVGPFGYRTAGAISPDGGTLAYASRSGAGDVYLVTVRLASGEADSIRVSGREDVPAADQIQSSTPIYSPSGDSIAFLLPNLIGLQLFLYEVRSRRIEVRLLRAPVATAYQPLPGWPRWTRDARIRFLTRLRLDGVPTDTLVVLEVLPRDPQVVARVAYKGGPPPGIHLESMGAYSFDADGRAAAFAMTAAGETGIYALRQGMPAFETIVLEAGLSPRNPIVVP